MPLLKLGKMGTCFVVAKTFVTGNLTRRLSGFLEFTGAKNKNVFYRIKNCSW
jgi:hypothetical protein